MDDDEARYLIDQYNKYVSWHVRGREIRLVETSLLLALFAIFLSLATGTVEEKVMALPNSVRLFVYTFAALGMFLVVMRDGRKTRKEYKDSETRLMLLEDHRSNFGSLPHITLSKIADPSFTTECLKRFLKENEPSLTDSIPKES
jgi:hypothetical protein